MSNPDTTVLLVDDEDATRYAVGRMLKKAGFTVKEAATGKDALRLADERPDIILLDVNLPDSNGYDICRQLKDNALTSVIPVVHLSASYIRPEDKAHGLNHGAEGYLTHPVDEAVLVATLNALLRFRRAEAALLASEGKFRTLVSVVPGLIFIADQQGGWEYVNSQWTKHTGPGGENFRGIGWMACVHADDAGRVAQWWKHITTSTCGGEAEFRICGIDGSYRWFLCRVAPIVDPSGKVQQWSGSCFDIEEQKRRSEDLHQASRAKDQFLAALSHELRTPLTPVLSAAQAIQADPSVSLEVRDSAAMIVRNIELEVRLIDDLLDINRITKGKLRLELQSVDAHQSINEVLSICTSELNARRMQVITSLKADRPYVHADPARFQQVLWNLIKNAVKFTIAEGQLNIATANAGDTLVITIADNGVGISAEMLPRIFDAFEQGGENVTRQFGGMGLGLAISKAVTDLHGGTLVAASRGAGKGASFVLTLPLSKTNGHPSRINPRTSVPTRRGTGQKILVVEDHPDTAKVLGHFLRLWGYKIEIAGTATLAMEVGTRQHFDLMISDIGLPDRSGLELVREIRAHYPIRAIALSGFGMDNDIRDAKTAGFTEHLVKPVNVNQLHAAIERVLNSDLPTDVHPHAP